MALFTLSLEDGYQAPILALLITIASLTLGYFVINEFIRYRSRLKGIPGPHGLPVIGNLYQVCTIHTFYHL